MPVWCWDAVTCGAPGPPGRTFTLSYRQKAWEPERSIAATSWCSSHTDELIISVARQHDEPSYEQELREGPSGKVYRLPRDNMNILRIWIPLIALAMLLLFGLLFVVVVGGTTGWISFAVAGFVIMTVLAYSAYLYRPFGE